MMVALVQVPVIGVVVDEIVNKEIRNENYRVGCTLDWCWACPISFAIFGGCIFGECSFEKELRTQLFHHFTKWIASFIRNIGRVT